MEGASDLLLGETLVRVRDEIVSPRDRQCGAIAQRKIVIRPLAVIVSLRYDNKGKVYISTDLENVDWRPRASRRDDDEIRLSAPYES
jgi:hypothetical protein